MLILANRDGKEDQPRNIGNHSRLPASAVIDVEHPSSYRYQSVHLTVEHHHVTGLLHEMLPFDLILIMKTVQTGARFSL